MEKINTQFTLDQAITLAEQVHMGQVDLARAPYIEHPRFVMNMLQSTDEKIAGILHDVVEDSNTTFEDLEQKGCAPVIIEALRLVTHPKTYYHTDIEYFLEIQNIINSKNQIAINVKYADLIHNSDIKRIQNPTDLDLARIEKYKKAMALLRPFISDYLKV